MKGMICCKKRELNSDPYTYGELYIDHIVVTVKKEVYNSYQIGDVVDYDYTDHVSFSGVSFHNLTSISKVGTEKILIDNNVVTSKMTDSDVDFYLKHQSNFFFWIKTAFYSLVLFFIEMYFVARFELDVQIQETFGKTYLLVFLFLLFFTINMVVLTPLMKFRHLVKVKRMSKFKYQVKLVEFIQHQSVCQLLYEDSKGVHQTPISMEIFHQIKNSPVLLITFLNNEVIYQVKKLS